jgi:hypothetical protein
MLRPVFEEGADWLTAERVEAAFNGATRLLV